MTQQDLLKTLHGYFPFGFHLARMWWDWLEIPSLLSAAERYRAATPTYPVRRLADRFNERRHQSSYALEPIKPGQLFSISVLVDVLRYLIIAYGQEQYPGAIRRGHDYTDGQRGRAVVEKPSTSFVNLFPPLQVMRGEEREEDYLQGMSAVGPNREMTTAEMILLALAIENPAFNRFRVLFDDADLKRESPYPLLVGALEEFFAQQPPFAPLGMKLFDCLRAPMQASPDSLEGQLDFMRRHWASFLPPELLERLLLATDVLREEVQMRGFGPGPSVVPDFWRKGYGIEYDYSEPAAFSLDADWMSNVVLIAKSVYVWLDQLSKKYRRHIRFLSDIPDEELDRLARWGFTGLWLIGVWERSPASQKIKQIMGNPEAASSAYSLYDYVIAGDLGGEAAFQNLRDRAWQRGIRLASDMVPNHMGVYSKWVIEHPNWFIQLDYPPFPVYQFTGVDLSWDPRVCIQIEDGYWQHRDAAVVFKRLDRWTGSVQYIYHGNDGTNMPWNDTAQLNFLMPEVREAVIQTILHVARQFPIIRFDAAMTLAKRHYQRLWFPQPGDGGAIPSRAEHGMTKEQFDKAMPREFWREVVDRIAAELPETLLLAEAFWLMEGYFVRTLGMHRVYNSAFMNMLKMEDNCKYRMTVKNVLKFSPEVLKRFVNFMNNPDERTAIDQFGKGDKYHGVAVMMVTMPGLPMFGHGQIEGLTEKYGMEYRRAYWDEQVDEEMVRRHEEQIFPLMRRRRLFSGAENFAFYDFRTREGWVDENVFAYSNRAGSERAIILYNNAYNTTSGWIHTSVPVNVGTSEQEFLVQKSLAEALAINAAERVYYIFREYQSGMEYLRSGRQLAEEGLFAVLHAYQYHAFLDFREVYDGDGSWWELARRLNGSGVSSIEETYEEMRLEPVLAPFREVLNAEMLYAVIDKSAGARAKFNQAASRLIASAQAFVEAESGYDEVLLDLLNALNFIPLSEHTNEREMSREVAADLFGQIERDQPRPLHHVAIAWLVIRQLGRLHKAGDATPPQVLAEIRMEEWLLRKAVTAAFQDFSGNETNAYFDASLVRMLLAHEDLLAPFSKITLATALKQAFASPHFREYLQVNLYNDILWLNREQLERLVSALLLADAIQLRCKYLLNDTNAISILRAARRILEAASQASYQVERLIELLAE